MTLPAVIFLFFVVQHTDGREGAFKFAVPYQTAEACEQDLSRHEALLAPHGLTITEHYCKPDPEVGQGI